MARSRDQMRATPIFTGVRSLNRTIRRVLAAAGLATVALLAVTLYARGVDRVEVLAAAMYVVVFVGVVAAGVVGGSTAALLSSAIYMVLRLPSLEILGTGRFAGLNLLRLLSYLAFGLIGGFAWELLTERLDKLESFDTIDDATHLLNARGLFDLLDHEMARGRRYSHSFSVVTLAFPADVFESLRTRRRRQAFSAFGAATRDLVRTTDRAGVVRDARRVTVVVFCPETTGEGAQVLSARLAGRLNDAMLASGVGLDRRLDDFVFTFPEQSVEIGAFRDDLIERTRQTYPDA